MKRIVRQIIITIQNLTVEEDIEVLVKKFIEALNTHIEDIKKMLVDYELLETLFELNLFLAEKSFAFWSRICKTDIVNQLPEDIKIFITKILRDPLQEKSYRDKLESFKDRPSFQYLIARCFIQEGMDDSNELKLKKGKQIIESLLCQTEKDFESSNYTQLIYAKVDVFLGLSQILPSQEAINCLDQIHKLFGKRQHYMNPIFTYRASLIALDKAKEASKKEIEVVANNYQTKNMEILSIFIAIAALIFGGGGIVYSSKPLTDQLVLLVALSLSVVSVLAIVITILRCKWVAFFLSMVIFIAVIMGGSIFLQKNNIVDFKKHWSGHVNIPQAPNCDTCAA